jgi:hypothetical protein
VVFPLLFGKKTQLVKVTMAVDQLKSPSSQLKGKPKTIAIVDVPIAIVDANVLRRSGQLQPEGATQRRWWREFSTPSRLRRLISTIV